MIISKKTCNYVNYIHSISCRFQGKNIFFIIHRNIYPWLSWWHSKKSSEKIFGIHFLAFTLQSTHEIYLTFSHLIWQNFLQLFCFSVCWLLLFFLRNTTKGSKCAKQNKSLVKMPKIWETRNKYILVFLCENWEGWEKVNKFSVSQSKSENKSLPNLISEFLSNS